MTISELQDEKRRLLQALWESEQTLSQLRAQKTEIREHSELIPRPPGQKGKNGWNMQEALRLQDNGGLYNEILVRQKINMLAFTKESEIRPQPASL